MQQHPARRQKLDRIVFALIATLALAGCSTLLPDLPSVSAPAGRAAPSGNPAPAGGNAAPAGDAAPAGGTAPAGEAAAGDIVDGTGYSFTAPAGWTVRSGASTQPVDVIVMNLADTDGFADNMNVLITPGTAKPDQMEPAAANQLKAAGFKNVTVHDRAVVAGTVAPHVTAEAELNDKRYLVEQFYLAAGGNMYVVTFSFSTTTSAADRKSLADSVLTSWDWA